MGYTTEFVGRFDIEPALSAGDAEFLKELSRTRRMARDERVVGPEYGVEGEFYTGGEEEQGRRSSERSSGGVLDSSRPPGTQPSLWCDWEPTPDRKGLQWNGDEKFYRYTEWLEYLIERVLEPRGYTVSGSVRFQGDNIHDTGVIEIAGNRVGSRPLI